LQLGLAAKLASTLAATAKGHPQKVTKRLKNYIAEKLKLRLK
jgi:hypothetical protein